MQIILTFVKVAHLRFTWNHNFVSAVPRNFSGFRLYKVWDNHPKSYKFDYYITLQTHILVYTKYKILIYFDKFTKKYNIVMKGKTRHTVKKNKFTC